MDASGHRSFSPGACASRDFPCSHQSLSQAEPLTRFSKQQRISTFRTTSVPEHPDPTETPFWGDPQTQEALEGSLEGEELGRLSMGEGHHALSLMEVGGFSQKLRWIFQLHP